MAKTNKIGLGILAALVASPAFAQDGCKDILKSGVFDSVDTGSRSEYQEIIISRFLSSTYDSSKNSSSGIGGKSIGQLVMGNAYNENEYNQKKSLLQQSYFNYLSHVEEWSLATRTANPDIVRAWESCMSSQSGLLARFETKPGDGKYATLVLTVKPAMGMTNVTLASNTIIPKEATLLSPNQFQKCLAKNAVITAGAACRVGFSLPSNTTMPLIISTKQGDAEAYLGKRLKYKKSVKPYSRVVDESLEANQGSWRSQVLSLESADVTAGYTFTPGSVTITGPTMRYGSGDGYCNQFSSSQSATSVTYKYFVYSTDNMSTICRLIVTANLEKSEFVADE